MDNVFVIEGTTYEVELLPADEAYDLWVSIIKVVGPHGAEMHVNGGDMDLKAFLEGIADRLPVELVREVRKALKKVTKVSVNGNMLPLHSVYDDHFKGKMSHLTQWLFNGLKIQYSDFFELLGTATDPGDQNKVADQQ